MEDNKSSHTSCKSNTILHVIKEVGVFIYDNLEVITIIVLILGVALAYPAIAKRINKTVNSYHVASLVNAEWQTSIDIYEYQLCHKQSNYCPIDAFHVKASKQYTFDGNVPFENTVYSYDIYSWEVVDTLKKSGDNLIITYPTTNYLPIEKTECMVGNKAAGTPKDIYEITFKLLDEKAVNKVKKGLSTEEDLYMCAQVDKEFWEAFNKYKKSTPSATIKYKYDSIHKEYTEINLVADEQIVASVDFSKINW